MKKLLFAIITFILTLSDSSGSTGGKARMDFDGDGKTDIAVYSFEITGNLFRELTWHVMQSRDGYKVVRWGAQDNNSGGFFDGQRPADYDGDGKTDIAVYRVQSERPPYTQFGQQSYFWILYSQTNTIAVIPFGRSLNSSYQDGGSSADFDGDGKADIYVVREDSQSGTIQWWILQSRDGFRFEVFGDLQSEPIVCGDYDGDGKADLTVVRWFGMPGNNYNFTIKNSSNGTISTFVLGNPANDNIYPGDYDGDGKTEIAVVSRTGDFPTYRWRYFRSSDGQFVNIKWGTLTDYPVPGDYDGDGTDDIAIYRQGAILSHFWIRGSLMGTQVWQFGTSQHGAFEGVGPW
jgi:hypothetical protein